MRLRHIAHGAHKHLVATQQRGCVSIQHVRAGVTQKKQT